MIKKILNKLGYYQLNQLRVGGVCGCCGKHIPTWVWVDTGDNWDDIGICDKCQSGDDKVDIDKIASVINGLK